MAEVSTVPHTSHAQEARKKDIKKGIEGNFPLILNGATLELFSLLCVGSRTSRHPSTYELILHFTYECTLNKVPTLSCNATLVGVRVCEQAGHICDDAVASIAHMDR